MLSPLHKPRSPPPLLTPAQVMTPIPTCSSVGNVTHPNVTHKRRKTEELEALSDLHDMEIPLEDMGDVIVLTGL